MEAADMPGDHTTPQTTNHRQIRVPFVDVWVIAYNMNPNNNNNNNNTSVSDSSNGTSHPG